MKKILSLIILSILAFNAFGQIQKIETRTYGLLDSIYYMNGNDTVYTESFHKNGLVNRRQWKQDSFEVYNTQGKLISQTKSHIKHSFGYFSKEPDNLKFHQRKEFYPDGRLLEYDYWQGDTLNTSITYSHSGKMIDSDSWHKHITADGKYHQFYFSKTDETGLTKSIKYDTLLKISIDSTFMDGLLDRVTTLELNTNTPLEYSIFDERGKIGFHWKIDSNRLHPDKDNGDCLYGFRNMRGDWVIPPQYDNVKPFNGNYYIVNKNEKYSIIDDFAKIILPSEYDFLGFLNNEDEQFQDYARANALLYLHNISLKNQDIPLKYRLGGKYGVIDYKGQILLPPLYDNVRKIQGDTFEIRVGKKWGLVDSRGRVIVQPKYYRVDFTDLPNVFRVIDTIQIDNNGFPRTQEIKGLVNDKGQTILDIRFTELLQNETMPNIFQVSSFTKNKSNNDYTSLDGIFDLKKGWILDTTYQDGKNGVYEFKKKHPFVADSIISQTYGYINGNFKIMLPFEYDELKPIEKKTFSAENCEDGVISSCHVSKIFIICKKDKKYGIFDETTEQWLIPLKYDYIHEFVVNYAMEGYGNFYQSYENEIRLLALKDGKWRWIDENNRLLSPDLMDYAGEFMDEGFSSNLFTTKNNKLTIADEDFYPKDQPLQSILDHNFENNIKVEDLITLNDFVQGEMLINQKGVLVVPPQYSIVSTFGKYAILKDKNGNQLLIDEEGNKRPFLPNYKIHLAQINEGVVIVEDTLKKTFGVVSPEGKVVLPSQYYAISAVDTNSVIWAKEKKSAILDTTPNVFDIAPAKNTTILDFYKSSDNYNLNAEDGGWQMFNTKGNLLTQTTFAFPFIIHSNHGIGVVKQSEDGKQFKVGIWRTTDGVNILPPQYDHIYFDAFNRLYFIYKKDKSGLKVGICDTTGHILIEPKFDRMSIFNGDYAFVQMDGKMGLVMRNGQYKVPPQYNAFKNTFENIDSLLGAYKDSIKNETDNPFYIPNGFSKVTFGYSDNDSDERNTPFDSLDIAQKRALKNMIVEKLTEGEFIDGDYVAFDRSLIKIFSDDASYRYRIPRLGLTSPVYRLMNINAHEKILGFILGEDENRIPRSCGNRSYKQNYHNFIQKADNTWQEVILDDLLVLNPDNNFKINQLLIDRLKDLKDANIDCSNSAGYFEAVKNRFYIYPEGLRFFFNHSWWRERIGNESVEVFFTWDDLKGYLKKR